ncbi:MAG: hypothetical protein LBG15_01030 [Dysgonamonadaceae bacterium]|jgi:hypothetical protein|nr:hypothetical protein [Dysgonamonadaceae bacterium]
MKNRECKMERSSERAIINSDGQRPSEKDAVSFQSRLKACHPNDYAPLGLGCCGIYFIPQSVACANDYRAFGP